MKYLVVWQDEGEVIQSEVHLGVNDPRQMTNNDWVYEAALSEEYSADEAENLVARGYALFLVCDFPTAFYDK